MFHRPHKTSSTSTASDPPTSPQPSSKHHIHKKNISPSESTFAWNIYTKIFAKNPTDKTHGIIGHADEARFSLGVLMKRISVIGVWYIPVLLVSYFFVMQPSFVQTIGSVSLLLGSLSLLYSISLYIFRNKEFRFNIDHVIAIFWISFFATIVLMTISFIYYQPHLHLEQETYEIGGKFDNDRFVIYGGKVPSNCVKKRVGFHPGVSSSFVTRFLPGGRFMVNGPTSGFPLRNKTDILTYSLTVVCNEYWPFDDGIVLQIRPKLRIYSAELAEMTPSLPKWMKRKQADVEHYEHFDEKRLSGWKNIFNGIVLFAISLFLITRIA